LALHAPIEKRFQMSAVSSLCRLDPELWLYVNHVMVGQSEDEVFLQFGQVQDQGEPRIHSRIVTSSVVAREILRLLQQALGAAEEREWKKE
jgi:hypothetical protein